MVVDMVVDQLVSMDHQQGVGIDRVPLLEGVPATVAMVLVVVIEEAELPMHMVQALTETA